ncbi:MFS transporter [Rhizobium laguerreae]|uniref:MFS transporter n=1 Tax=Rhizobium laguerreae TaxID=1076926 RepID=UPI001C900E28|nr:MFS transporter [Rhizobium laguerreae]MBY3416323.1 MFS transporter [Rhizobium laguerreae]
MTFLHSSTTLAKAHTSRTATPLSYAATVVCIVLVAVDLRPAIVSLGPLLPMIRAQFALTNTQAALLTTIPAVLMGVLAFPAPWLAHRFGRDRMILLALALLMTATGLRALAATTFELLAATVAVGAGIAIAGALIPGFVKQSYPRRAAILMGIYAMSLGLGSTLAAALAHPLALFGNGWRFSTGVFALPCLVAIGAWMMVARSQAEALPTQLADARGSGIPIRNRTAWLLALYSTLNNVLFFGLVSWTAPMFREFGMSDATAGLVLASFTAAFMFGNPAAALLSRTDDRRTTIAFFALLALVGTIIEAVSPGLLPFVFIPMIAFGVGGTFTLTMILPLDNASTARDANNWTGFVMGIGYLAGSFGPLSIGMLRDVTGSFAAPAWLLASVALLTLTLSPFLQPHHHRAARHRSA